LTVSFRRREEPLHERLAREGGLGSPGEPPPHDTTPRWGAAGIHGVPRAREWDATGLAEAPDLDGDDASFVALPDGTLLVEADGDHEPLADALEGQISPPYRAEAVRRDERWWAVAARRIEVSELPADVPGDRIELTVNEDERSLRVDGMPSFGRVPALEQVGAARGVSYVLEAERLDGRLWEIRVAPL
jgi:hypothetical protein